MVLLFVIVVIVACCCHCRFVSIVLAYVNDLASPGVWQKSWTRSSRGRHAACPEVESSGRVLFAVGHNISLKA